MEPSAEPSRGTSIGEISQTEVPEELGAPAIKLRRFMTRIYQINAVLAVVGVIAARIVGADLIAVNFFVGSMIGLLMLYATVRLVRHYITPSENIKRNRRRLLLLLLAKLPILGIMLFFVTSEDWFHPIGLFCGVSMIPFTLTLYGMAVFINQSSANEQVGRSGALDNLKRIYR